MAYHELAANQTLCFMVVYEHMVEHGYIQGTRQPTKLYKDL